MNVGRRKLLAYYSVIMLMLGMVFVVLLKSNVLASDSYNYTTYFEKNWVGDDSSKRPEELNVEVVFEGKAEEIVESEEESDEEDSIATYSIPDNSTSVKKTKKSIRKTKKITNTEDVTFSPDSPENDTWEADTIEVPEDYKVKNVTEEEIPGYKLTYKVDYQKEDRKIKVVLTNTWTTGDLTIQKKVQGADASDKDKEFDFTVTLSENNITGTYGDLRFENGVAEFRLKDGESVTAEKLPINITYEVTEEPAEGYYCLKSENSEGTIEEGVTTATFTNGKDKEPEKPVPQEKTGDLKVSKNVTGSGDKNKDFAFRVELSDKTVNGIFGDMTFENGTAEFSLKHGESINATGLPAGITYTVTETGTAGYTVTKTGDKGTIADGITAVAEFTNYKPSGGNSGGGGGGGGSSSGGGGGTPGRPVTPVTPQTQEPQTPDETPGDVPPAPWYKLPVMGDEQFGPGFVNDSSNQITLPEAQTETESIIPQLKELYAQNNELVGWITVPGTGFGYPVMLSQNDPFYYQHHTFDKQLDEVGIPFIGPYCKQDSMNVLIHGHNMKDVSQFGYIWNYQDPNFRQQNPTIDFKTLTDENGSYEVMAVFFAPEYAEGTENVFWWYRYIGDMNKNQFDYYVQNAKALSLYDTGVTAEYGDKLITLETCASSKDSTRLVVVARKKAAQTATVTQ